MRLGLFETPRPMPSRLLPALAGAAVVALALPVFLAADLPLDAWLLAATLYVAGQVLAALLARVGTGADKLARSGVVGIGMTFRSVAVGIVLIAAAASDTRLGVTAALLYALAYTLELAVGLVSYFGQEATR